MRNTPLKDCSAFPIIIIRQKSLVAFVTTSYVGSNIRSSVIFTVLQFVPYLSSLDALALDRLIPFDVKYEDDVTTSIAQTVLMRTRGIRSSTSRCRSILSPGISFNLTSYDGLVLCQIRESQPFLRMGLLVDLCRHNFPWDPLTDTLVSTTDR